MSTDDKRIREFAYQIWESEGKPVGQEKRHWEMACKLVEAERLAPGKSAKASGSKTAGTKSAAGKPDGKPDGKLVNAKGIEPTLKAKAKPKAKPAAASAVIPPGEKKTAEKKPRAARKPPTA